MVEGAGGALQFGRVPEARHAALLALMLSLGPAIVAALPGAIPARGGSYGARDVPPDVRSDAAPREDPVASAFRRNRVVFTRNRVAPLLLSVVSLILMHFVWLDVDRAWVGFRAGQMFLVAVPALVAGGLATSGMRRRITVAVVALAALAGAPTTLIDAYNAQDITNVSPSPNGPWTVTVTADESQGLEFLRRVTPANAVVQMDPLARERVTWSLIPSFAQRRMAAGRPISLLGGTSDGSEYGERSRRVQRMYETADAQEAAAIARALRIDYIWIDRVERAAYPAGIAKFTTASGLFTLVFQNPEVLVLRVQ
jgi:hypothetical protein